ncbi:MAG: PGF-pre-PGF domain-containing protein [bacterium]|nr:PGF-pre-PGF domain-containing protein [bacterium]
MQPNQAFGNMTRTHKNKARIAMLTLFLIVLAGFVAAVPVPHGIDGIIYTLDGVTQVDKGTRFSVYDTTSGYYTEGVTGRGTNPGKYAVTLKGGDGDNIILTAWNKANNASRSVTLYGVLHGVDLLLNTTVPNYAPNITSEPVTTAQEDYLYSYDVDAEDENNDLLEYSLLDKPSGMIIDSETGIIEWTPAQSQAGSNNVIVNVSDGDLMAYQSFTVFVSETNDAPVIVSLPTIAAIAKEKYTYDVNATDEENDSIHYSLLVNPSGMIIDSETGLIEWTPEKSQVGSHNVTVNATDTQLSDSQSYTVIVTKPANILPNITSEPVTTAQEDSLYVYDVDATDEGDYLIYELLESPVNMLINDSTGLITWLPLNADVGSHNVSVMVIDDENGTAVQSFVLDVENINDAPVITSEPITEATVYRFYIYYVTAIDEDNFSLSYQLLEAPRFMRIDDETGRISWFPMRSQVGTVNLVEVEVSDGVLTDTQTFNVTVLESGSVSMISSNTESSVIQVSSGGGGGSTLQTMEQELVAVEENNSSLNDLVINFKSSSQGGQLIVRKLAQAPPEITALNKQVYEYIEIDPWVLEEDKIDEAKIRFSVDKKWLENNNALKTDIILNRYHKDKWQTLETEIIEESEETISYESKTTGFSYFAISLNTAATELKEPVASTIDVPYRISGVIYESDKQVSWGTKYVLTDKNTGESIKGKTGMGNYPGAYVVLVYGEIGDNLELKIGSQSFEFKLDGNMDGTEVYLESRELVTGGNSFAGKPSSGKIIYAISILIVALSIVFAVYFKKRKKR